jgi:hypothetical protein
VHTVLSIPRQVNKMSLKQPCICCGRHVQALHTTRFTCCGYECWSMSTICTRARFPGTICAVVCWTISHSPQAICMQAGRCAAVGLFMSSHDRHHVYDRGSIWPCMAITHETTQRRMWALFFKPSLWSCWFRSCCKRCCTWVTHSTKRLHRLLFPVSSRSGAAADWRGFDVC